MFPSAVPNDPLVPTAVLGETFGVVGYVTFITNKYSVVITHHHHIAPVLVALVRISLCIIGPLICVEMFVTVAVECS